MRGCKRVVVQTAAEWPIVAAAREARFGSMTPVLVNLMSALPSTLLLVRGMSALPPIADID